MKHNHMKITGTKSGIVALRTLRSCLNECDFYVNTCMYLNIILEKYSRNYIPYAHK